ncbi:MAG: hypothetical protein KME40_03930 [Komarekiella atlantica HA4396-MV6]|jgi:hypothetical protein|nr:hypothetical protein [Komarekiella atlantica HA4396-MV6]
MLKTVPDTFADLATALLIHYSFDLGGYNAVDLVNRWQTQYPIYWLHLAVIEALYQGRYKAVSVQQILVFWQRRGQATHHFNMEFERLICSKFPESLTASTAPALPPVPKKTSVETKNLQLPPARVGNAYQQSNTAPMQLISREQKAALGAAETKQASRENQSIPKSPHSREVTSLATRQLASAVSHRQTSQESPPPTTSPIPPKTKLLPPAAIHPPIGRFTPEKSDRSESFTSKLKAMYGEQRQPLV